MRVREFSHTLRTAAQFGNLTPTPWQDRKSESRSEPSITK